MTTVEFAAVSEQIAASVEELSSAVIENSKQTTLLFELSEKLHDRTKNMKI